MIAVVQRVSEARVSINNKIVSQIKKGFLVLLGCAKGDKNEDAEYIAKKICGLRIFNDKEEKMNLSIKDVDGAILLVSQFTLLAYTRKGNRPSFTEAELPEEAERLYEYTGSLIANDGILIEKGVFGEHMEISLINDGPVTIILNSKAEK